MIGLVLCGGQSTRMASDKGLLKLDNKAWSLIAYELLSSLNMPVFVSINKDQQNEYGKIFKQKELIIDDENLNVGGPLKGLLSAHLQHRNENILLLACDMINMQKHVLETLIASYKKETTTLAFKHAIAEPLCAVYSAKALQEIYHLYQQQQLKSFSMMYVLELMQASYLNITDEWLACFNNYNSPADILNFK